MKRAGHDDEEREEQRVDRRWIEERAGERIEGHQTQTEDCTNGREPADRAADIAEARLTLQR